MVTINWKPFLMGFFHLRRYSIFCWIYFKIWYSYSYLQCDHPFASLSLYISSISQLERPKDIDIWITTQIRIGSWVGVCDGCNNLTPKIINYFENCASFATDINKKKLWHR